MASTERIVNPIRWRTVERTIRDRIAERIYQPGGRLPTYDELEREFQLSRLMLQQVMRHLKQDGFVTSRERQGLFVSPKPPHLNRVAMVIARFDPVRFWEELYHSAQFAATERGMELVLYRNWECDASVCKKLREDVANHLIAGIISPGSLPDGYDITASSVPVAMPDLHSAPIPISFIFRDALLVQRALDRLQQRGATRIALIGNLNRNPIRHFFDAEIVRKKLFSAPEWRFEIGMESRKAIVNIIQLLLALPAGKRPDGIFVADDNYTPEVVSGAASTSLRIPDELPIVSHYNWSVGPFDQLPVEYIGYDLVRLMRHAFTAIQEYCKTGNIPEPYPVMPQFKEELQR